MQDFERLKTFASPAQLAALEAAEKHGVREGARQLGVHVRTVQRSIEALKKKAAQGGYAPGHWTSGVAAGYRMGKVTVQRGSAGEVERVWERQHPEEHRVRDFIDASFEAMQADLSRLPPLERPASALASLANLYTLTDYHLGMYAWAKETGDAWNLEIAERTLMRALDHLVGSAPAAGRAILNIQGDFLHFDGLEPVTPTHRHVVDAAGRYAEIVGAAIRVLRRAVDLLLTRHDDVVLLFVEGNHDLAGSMWLRKMFGVLYENEPRVRVNDSELPFYVEQFGKVMIGVHHGHKVKNEQLPGIFAAQFPTVWGATTKRFAHCGHRHHVDEKEYAGMLVTQHPTLAARDAHSSRGGYISERAAICVTYHREFGQVARTFVSPEMLEDSDPPVLKFRAA